MFKVQEGVDQQCPTMSNEVILGRVLAYTVIKRVILQAIALPNLQVRKVQGLDL